MTTSDLPGEISGTHPLRGWLNKLRRAIIARTPQLAPGYRLRENATGFNLEILDAGGDSLGLSLHRLKSVQGDYLTCKAWDGTEAGKTTSDAGADVYIAKPAELRDSIVTETIEGEVFTYTYATGPATTPTITNKLRTATVGGVVREVQIVTPEWLVNFPIYALRGSTGVFRGPGETNPVPLLMVGGGRGWALHA
jgi:hypothetical protein